MVSWRPETRLEWFFFGTTTVQAFTNITIQTVILVTYLNWVNSVAYQVPISYVIPLTLCVNSLGCLFQIILTLDAYRIKNHIQVFVQCAANICLSISTVLQYGETRHAVSRILVNHDRYGTPFADVDWPFWKKISPGLMVCTVVTCVSSAIMCWLARGLYREFSWALYQHVSPDKKIQTKYAVYQIYLVLLKFTPYFVFAFIIFYDFIDVHFQEPEFSLTLSIIPATLVHVAIAVYFVRHERRIGMAFVLLLHAANIAYLISRLLVLYGHSFLADTLLKDEMVFYLCVGVVFSTSALLAGCVCFYNFKKGLRPILLGQVQRKPRAHELEDDYYVQRLNYNVVPLADRDSQRFALD
ncbi:hypothetical protein J4E83_001323 [Alternaria metachromatica]|uniref:uncharacterized protein n=1 Tax=Alternaria metachromatica TaxID=283354 RepID=UPI0020C3D9EF|nr:uncharacterized protein J4E83_001323 [Alternaria metachromatica]KAI4636368.1 hypothetical protein J4E83_001323 [Alternaria metachromatica]